MVLLIYLSIYAWGSIPYGSCLNRHGVFGSRFGFHSSLLDVLFKLWQFLNASTCGFDTNWRNSIMNPNNRHESHIKPYKEIMLDICRIRTNPSPLWVLKKYEFSKAIKGKSPFCILSEMGDRRGKRYVILKMNWIDTKNPDEFLKYQFPLCLGDHTLWNVGHHVS